MTSADRATRKPLPTARRHPLRRVGLTLLVLLALTITGTAWLIANPTLIRLAIEHHVSDTTGRDFTIDGGFAIQLGRVITVQAEQMQWHDRSQGRLALLEVGHAIAAIDTWSLIRRPFLLVDVKFRNALIHFDWSGDGFNWHVGNGQSVTTRDTTPVLLKTASFENVVVNVRHPRLTDDLTVRVIQANVESDADHHLELNGNLWLHDRELALNGSIGPFPELLLTGAIDLEVSLVGPLGNFDISGSARSIGNPTDIQLTLALKASDAGALAQHLHLPIDTSGTVDLSASIDINHEKAALSSNGFFGEYRINGYGVTDDLTAVEALDMSLHASGPSARDMALLLSIPPLPDVPYELAMHARPMVSGSETERLQTDTRAPNTIGHGPAKALQPIRDIDLTVANENAGFPDVTTSGDIPPSSALPFPIHTATVSHELSEPDNLEADLRLGDTIVKLRGVLNKKALRQGSQLRWTLDAPKADQLAPLIGLPMPPGARLELAGRTRFNDDQIAIEDFHAAVAGARLTGSAWLDVSSEPTAFHFDGNAKGSDLRALVGHLLPLTFRDQLPHVAFSARSRVAFSDNRLSVETAELQFAGTRIQFNGVHDTSGPKAESVGMLSMSGNNLADWIRGPDIAELREAFTREAFTLEGKLLLDSTSLRIEPMKAHVGNTRVSGSVSWSGDGFDSVVFDLQGKGEDLSALVPDNLGYRPAQRPLHMELLGQATADTVEIQRMQATVGESQLAISGTLQRRPAWAARGLTLAISGPRMSDLGTFGSHRFPPRPFKLQALIESDAKSHHVKDIRFVSGDNDLRGHLGWGSGKKPRIEADLVSTRFTLDDFVNDAAPETALPAPKPPLTGISSNNPLRLDLLDQFDAVVDLRIDNLLSDQRLWRNVVLDGEVSSGSVKLRRASLDAAAGRLNISAELNANGTTRHLLLRISASDAMFASESMTIEEIQRLPRHAIDARLSAQGNTPHELVSSLNGFIWIIGGEGYGRRTKLAPLYGDLVMELLAAINPGSRKNPEIRIDCDGLYLEVEKGVIKTAPSIVIKTEHIIVLATGFVDLRNETIDIVFETTPLRGLGINLGDVVNPLTKLSGTLRNPKIVLDPKGTVIEGGAAVATAGLTVLAKNLIKRFIGSHRICEKVGQKALEIRRKKDPNDLPDLATLFAETEAVETTNKTDPAPSQDRKRPPSSLELLYTDED